MASAREDPTSRNNYRALSRTIQISENQVSTAVGVFEHIEDVRHHQDFSEQIEIDRPRSPRVKLPDKKNYGTATAQVQGDEDNMVDDGELEEGEIDEVDQLDGADLGDVELEDLLELEQDGAENLYNETYPTRFDGSSFGEYLTQNPPPTPALRKSLMKAPSIPPGLPPPGITPPNEYEKYLDRIDAWITKGEYALTFHPVLRRYRVKTPSILRTCWVPKGMDGDDEDGSIIL